MAETSEQRLISAGEELIRKLKDPATDPQELHGIAQVAIARDEFFTMLAARDDRGRSPLHVAATRGDTRLCEAMMLADPSLVNVADEQRSTPIMDAALLGRSLVTSALLEHAADVTQKNRDCMSALQLACVNEGAGHGDVVAQLVKAGADPSGMCWQTTPLMAAADSGHIWALQTLVELGANAWQQNDSGFTALDFARDMETAQFLYDVMQGDQLSNRPAPRFDAQRLVKNAEERRRKLHVSARQVALEDALAALDAPAAWLPSFRETGDHFGELRKLWHRICLRCHPDKQPEGLEEEELAEWTSQFQGAVAAFEAVEQHFRRVCKEPLPSEPAT